MFLSKVTLQQSSQTVKELAKLGGNGAYSSHQLLWQLFTEETKRHFLFRQETGLGGLPEFFVLSQTEPTANPVLFNVHTKAFNPSLVQGQRLAFKLRVNPTICVTDTSGKSQRHDVLMHAKRQAKQAGKNDVVVKALMEQAAQGWLSDERRLQQWGMSLDMLPDVESYTQHRNKKKSGHELQFSSVDFQGVLTLTDSERFLTQYVKGFGRAKALGCGLMLIRPL